MTIADEISDLRTNTQNIKTAIENAGGTVGNTGLSGVASEIATIPSGGGDPFDGQGPVSEIDKKYAEMEMTFELDTRPGEMEKVYRTMKLNGEYVMEWEEYQYEDWGGQTQTAYRKNLKSKFADIHDVHYLKPFNLDLQSLSEQIVNELGWFDPNSLSQYLEFGFTFHRLYEFPQINTTPYDVSAYGGVSLPTAFFNPYPYINYSKLYSNTSLLSIASSLDIYVCLENGNYLGMSSDNPISFSGVQNLQRINVYPSSNRTVYIGDLGNIETLDVKITADGNQPSVSFSENSYPNIHYLTGVHSSELQKFPNLENWRYLYYDSTNQGRTPFYVGVTNVPNWAGGADLRGAFQAARGNIVLTGGSSSVDFRDTFRGSIIDSVDISGMSNTTSLSLYQTFSECYRLRTVKFPAVSFSFISSPFHLCYALSTLDLSRVVSSSAVSLASNIGNDVPKSCAITVIDQTAADAFTAKGFTNVTVAS